MNFQLGKLYPEGYYAGSMNGFHYFIEPNNNKRLNWEQAMSYYNSSKFELPTKDELLLMYKNKTTFNENCPKNEQWNNGIYWTSITDEVAQKNFFPISVAIDFDNGVIFLRKNIYGGNVRGVRKIPMK